ncbi:TlpA family protein disulfide reductase [Aquisphaera insulae]|uniref:TlpA family protein disulfide reductase n=1 Tax=Aquisphaera insulae TaxID=2712864 RepID=UPI0013EA41E9|nr:TlpA disulfide reductase family protein [Aquisphaera insulae]
MRRLIAIASLALVATPVAMAGTLDGRWDATVKIQGNEIPFRIDFSGEGQDFVATLFDGDLKVTSTSGRLEREDLVADFGHYLTRVKAHLKDGRLEGRVEGRFERDKYIAPYEFHAHRHVDAPASSGKVPEIGGHWVIPIKSPKGETSWRFIVRQNGPEVAASILRVDGDTGTLSGSYHDGKFVVSHFSGSRPLLLEITPRGDGTLSISPRGAFTAKDALVAYRPEAANAKGLPKPADFNSHTTIKDPNAVFSFRFPDLDGKVVSNSDSRFQDKVIVAVVTGTWCPNCHDEAQYLVQLHRKYRDRGLEVVALDFEEPEQQEDGLTRARAFIKKYGVEYPYLVAGAPVEMWEKVPQANNLNSWPTTLFIGRDGKVKSIHAGFASPASGEYHRQLKEEFAATVERLLDEGKTASR